MYAILKTGGKQYKVSEGDVIYVEKLGVEDGATVTFDEVLAVGEGDSITVGAPYVSGAAVTGTVSSAERGAGPFSSFCGNDTSAFSLPLDSSRSFSTS